MLLRSFYFRLGFYSRSIVYLCNVRGPRFLADKTAFDRSMTYSCQRQKCITIAVVIAYNTSHGSNDSTRNITHSKERNSICTTTLVLCNQQESHCTNTYSIMGTGQWSMHQLQQHGTLSNAAVHLVLKVLARFLTSSWQHWSCGAFHMLHYNPDSTCKHDPLMVCVMVLIQF